MAGSGPRMKKNKKQLLFDIDLMASNVMFVLCLHARAYFFNNKLFLPKYVLKQRQQQQNPATKLAVISRHT